MDLSSGDLQIHEGRLPIEHFLFQEIDESRLKKELWASSWTPAEILSESEHSRTLVAWRVGESSGTAEQPSIQITHIVNYTKNACGFLFLRQPGALWEITLIYVRPEIRGQGAGAALLAKAMHIALSSDFSDKRIGLEVRRDNLAAIKTYRKAGFLDVGVRRRYYRDGCDALLFERSL